MQVGDIEEILPPPHLTHPDSGPTNPGLGYPVTPTPTHTHTDTQRRDRLMYTQQKQACKCLCSSRCLHVCKGSRGGMEV